MKEGKREEERGWKGSRREEEQKDWLPGDPLGHYYYRSERLYAFRS